MGLGVLCRHGYPRVIIVLAVIGLFNTNQVVLSMLLDVDFLEMKSTYFYFGFSLILIRFRRF